MVVKDKYSDSEFESLLNKYDYNFKKGDLVKGVVWSYDSTGVIVDIGSKTSAIVPLREAKIDFSEPIEEILEKGKEYEFLITKEEDEDGRKRRRSLKRGILGHRHATVSNSHTPTLTHTRGIL